MNDPGDLPQHRVVQLVAVQEGLEAAVVTVMRKLHPSHVERRRVGRHLVGIVDEDELRFQIEEAADQPSAGCPVDVAVRRVAHLIRPEPPPQPAPPALPPPAGQARAPAAGSSRVRESAAAHGEAGRGFAGESRRDSPGPLSASATSARYSTATASAIRPTSSRSCATEASSATHTDASPPASLARSASHSSCSRLRASSGSAARPSTSCAAPRPRSLRQSAMRGVDGSRGSRYAEEPSESAVAARHQYDELKQRLQRYAIDGPSSASLQASALPAVDIAAIWLWRTVCYLIRQQLAHL